MLVYTHISFSTSDRVLAYMNLNELYLQALEYLYSIKGITLFAVYANVYNGRNASKMKGQKKLSVFQPQPFPGTHSSFVFSAGERKTL